MHRTPRSGLEPAAVVPARRSVARATLALALLVAGLCTLGGCAITSLVGGMAQNFEYQKEIEVLAKYEDLEGKSVAVIVESDYAIAFEHPNLVRDVTGGVSVRLARNVADATVLSPDAVLAWQWRTPQWNAYAFGEMAEALNVDRLIYIEIYEYRLHPPGNRWLWEGACSASVSVVERDGFDPDMFVDTFEVISKFPSVTAVDRDSANKQQIETGLLSDFIRRCAWLFHKHLEPKYPDKYRPEAA